MSSSSDGVADDSTLRRIDIDISELEDRWHRLADRHDSVAFKLRTEIVEELDRLRSARAERLRVQQESNERETLIAELSEIYGRTSAELDAACDTLITRGGIPDASDLAHVYALGWDTEMLRAALFAATQQREFARRIDGLDRLRYGWHQQQIGRMRLLDRVSAPGSRPEVPLRPWNAQVSRLRGLINKTKEGS